jgi:hypothetical protein
LTAVHNGLEHVGEAISIVQGQKGIRIGLDGAVLIVIGSEENMRVVGTVGAHIELVVVFVIIVVVVVVVVILVVVVSSVGLCTRISTLNS